MVVAVMPLIVMFSKKPCRLWQNVWAWKFASHTIRPYCSKHNPIEHRLFPHITRACQGVVFHTLDIAKQFMEKAKTTQPD